MPNTLRSVLLSPSEIEGMPNAFGYPMEAWEAAIEAKTKSVTPRDGVFEATELLLREAAVAIQFVDINDPGQPIRDGDTELYKRPRLQLAFNDHGGGSESDYKILLNCFFEGEEPGTYVLYSPPEEDGTPSNLAFRRADFTFLSMEPNRIHDRWVPNPLKTAGAARYMGRSDYDFYLVGDASTPQRLPEAFRTAGFTFEPTPYELFDTYYSSRESLHNARMRTEGPSVTWWPREQFASQIATLKEAERAKVIFD